MASFGSKGSKTEPANSEPGSDDHFRQMRDRMNRERESFFQDSPSSFFGRESPFFRSRPGFEDFQSGSPNFHHTTGFPSTDSMDSRKYSAPTQTAGPGGPTTSGPTAPTSRSTEYSESIPIKVFHEHPQPRSNNDKYRYGGAASSSKTADIPSSSSRTMYPNVNNDSAESPRVTRAHSEPPKTGFNQRPQQMKTTIPLGKLSEQMEHNLSTSASDSSVPASNNSNRETTTTAPAAPPPLQKQQPTNVRHIPIIVEGRDKPVIGTTTTKDIFADENKQVPNRQQQHPVPPTRPSRPTDFVRKVDINKNPSSLAPNSNLKEEPTSPLSPIPSDQPIPMGYTETEHTNIPSSSVNGASESVVESETPSALPPEPIPMPCSSEYLVQQGNTSSSNATNSATPKETVTSTTNVGEQQKPAAAANQDKKLDPCLDKLAKIQANVGELVKQLEKFKGSKDSKEYKYLDEMLTRNLLALDGLNLEGRDDVRQVRKESIKSINRCLSILESKAANVVNADDQAVKNNEILSDLASKD